MDVSTSPQRGVHSQPLGHLKCACRGRQGEVLDEAFTIQVLAAFKGAEFDGTLGMNQMGDGQEQNPVRQIVQAQTVTIQPRRRPGVAFLGHQSLPFPSPHPPTTQAIRFEVNESRMPPRSAGLERGACDFSCGKESLVDLKQIADLVRLPFVRKLRCAASNRWSRSRWEAGIGLGEEYPFGFEIQIPFSAGE